MKKNIFISPLEDFAFKQIFGEKKNLDNTRAFLKTILNIPKDEYGDLSIGNPVFGKTLRKEKSGIVDIKLETKSGKIIHIELQVEKRANMKNRILYYGARLIGDQLKWGEDYDKINHVISIVICDHVLVKEETSYINVYELRNEQNRSFTDKLKVVIIELPKLSENCDSEIWPWLKFLKCTKKEEYEMLTKKYPQLKNPVNCARRMGLMESIKHYYFHRNLAKTDERMLHLQWKLDGKEEGIAEGKVIGIAEGKAEGGREKEKFVLDLIDQGLSADEIKTRLTETRTTN